MISPKNPGFLSPAVVANSESRAQLAGSPTTACFSFCSSLALAGTGGIPVPGQPNTNSLPVYVHSQPGVTRGAHSTSPTLALLSLAPVRPQHSFPCVPAKLPRSCLAVLCHALPAPLTVALGTGAQGHSNTNRAAQQGKGGPTGFAGNSIQVLHYGKGRIPQCLADPRWPKTEPEVTKVGQEGPTPGRAHGGDTAVGALRWGDVQGWERVGAADPWGCECCASLWDAGFQANHLPKMVLYSAAVGAQEHLQIRHFCPRSCWFLGCGICVHHGHSVGHFLPPPTELHFGSLALALQHSPSSVISYTDLRQGHFLMSFLLFSL